MHLLGQSDAPWWGCLQVTNRRQQVDIRRDQMCQNKRLMPPGSQDDDKKSTRGGKRCHSISSFPVRIVSVIQLLFFGRRLTHQNKNTDEMWRITERLVVCAVVCPGFSPPSGLHCFYYRLCQSRLKKYSWHPVSLFRLKTHVDMFLLSPMKKVFLVVFVHVKFNSLHFWFY